MRGLLAEFGVVVAQSDAALRRVLSDLSQHALPASLIELLGDLNRHWQQLHERIATCDRRIAAHAQADERCARAQAISTGSLTADAMVATVGSARPPANTSKPTD